MRKKDNKNYIYNYSGGHEVSSIREININWWFIASIVFVLLMIGLSFIILLFK